MSAAAKIQKLYNEASNRDKKCKELVAQEPNKGKVINPFRPSRPSIDLKGDLYNGLKELCEADEQEKTQMGHLHVSKVQKAKGAEEKSSSDSEQSDDETDLSNSDSEQSDDETEKSSSDSEQSDDETDHLSSDSDDEKPNDSNSDPKQLGDDEKPNDSSSDPKQSGDDEEQSQTKRNKQINESIDTMLATIAEQAKTRKTDPKDINASKEDVEAMHKAVEQVTIQRYNGPLTKLFMSTPIYSRIFVALMKGIICGTLNASIWGSTGVWDASMAFVTGFCNIILREYKDLFLYFFTISPSATISKLLDAVSSIPFLGTLLQMLRRLFAFVAEYGPGLIRWIMISYWFASLGFDARDIVAPAYVLGAAKFLIYNDVFKDGSVGQKVSAMIRRVVENMQTYLGPFVNERVYSTLYLSLRGEYVSAALQASTLIGGALSVVCGDTNLRCRKVALLLAFPGAAAALHLAAEELVKMATILTNTIMTSGYDTLETKYAKCCMGLAFKYREEHTKPKTPYQEEARKFAEYHKALNLGEEDVSKLNKLRQGELPSDLKTTKQLTRLLAKANNEQNRMYHPDKYKGPPNTIARDSNAAYDELKKMYGKYLERAQRNSGET